ncbi:MAG: tRNA (N(6)-L-threonylcarbamoyladenosine(37)-C(2))-methylthiotransferase MtaB [Gemmatimonadaceae bacterium]
MKLYLRTLGCRANQYDSETVRAMAVAGGATLVETAEEADVALFNSCAVTAAAEADLRQGVRRAARRNAALRTVVMGCAAERDGGGARSALGVLPGVSHVLPGTDFASIALALGLPPAAAGARAAAQTGARGLLRVQDGCDEHCTFCATTLARGANRSRPVTEVVNEARRLAEHHPEIVITGIHIGSYGADIDSSLGVLVERLVDAVPQIRFRLSSVEASEVDDRLGALLREGGPRLAPHLHAPLQSGSDAVLKRMGRHWYTASTYAAAIERLAEDRSVFGLSADVIAGFPGETDDDHAATVALVRALPFTALHVFSYSPRPGTAAPRLGGMVEASVARRRAAELRALGAEMGVAYRQRRAGGTADVVVVRSAGAARGVDAEGLTEDYLTVGVADPTLPRGARLTARLAARLTTTGRDLVATRSA